MKKAGSTRKTANGWNLWKTANGEYLIDLYRKLTVPEPEEDVVPPAPVASAPVLGPVAVRLDKGSRPGGCRMIQCGTCGRFVFCSHC